MMKKLWLVLMILGILACEDTEIQPGNDNLPNLRSLSNQETELIEATNQFSFNIIKHLDSEESQGNFFISPVSIGYALGMVFNGAEGETKKGIKKTLDFGDLSDQEINRSFKDLTALLLNMDKKVELGLANAIWYRDVYDINQEFASKMQEYYDAKIEGLDFDKSNANDIINDWIEGITNDRIQDMLDEIPVDAVMYLVNAIYFKADWTYQFDESATQKEDFFLESGEPELVDMMYSEGATVNYYYGQETQLFDIPYGNQQFSMTILLPHEGASVDEVWQSMDVDKLNQMDLNSDSASVELYLPKFELKYKKELKEILAQLGMHKSFGSDAQFPYLFEEDDLELFVSKVLHQSFLKVDEEGSEAAAATSVGIEVTSIGGGKPQVIKINRPFALMIREKHTGSILFAGKIVNPNE